MVSFDKTEALRGQGTAEEEEEAGLTVRRSSALRRRGQPPEVNRPWRLVNF